MVWDAMAMGIPDEPDWRWFLFNGAWLWLSIGTISSNDIIAANGLVNDSPGF